MLLNNYARQARGGMKTNFEGISQVVGYKKGTYKFAKTN